MLRSFREVVEMSWNQRRNTKEIFREERSGLMGLLFVAKSVVSFHYEVFGAFRKQVRERWEKWRSGNFRKARMSGSHGSQGHPFRVDKAVYILKWLIYRLFSKIVIADNLISQWRVAGRGKNSAFSSDKLRSLFRSVIIGKWPLTRLYSHEPQFPRQQRVMSIIAETFQKNLSAWDTKLTLSLLTLPLWTGSDK